MTRKDYVKVAAIIRMANERYTDHAPTIFIRDQLANMLAEDNPRFDRQRFLAACRVES